MKQILGFIYFSALSLLLCSPAFSQSSLPQDSLNPWTSRFVTYAEAGTIIFVSQASANFEYRFYSIPNNRLHLLVRVGGGTLGIFYGNVGYGGIAGLTLLTSARNSHFEVDLAAFLGANTGGMGNPGFFAFPISNVGYRYQRPQGGFVFKVKAGLDGAGIGLGWSF